MSRENPGRTKEGHEIMATCNNGEPIAADEVYAVTPTGAPDYSWRADYVFLQPQHFWRAQWLPETAGAVRVVRADVDNPMHYWVSAPGLLGVGVHAVRGRFRIVQFAELRAAAADLAEQMSRWHPDTIATLALPEGFTIDVVPPGLVYGTVTAHNTALRQSIKA